MAQRWFILRQAGRRLGVAAGIVMLCWASPGFSAANGPGFGIKVGAQVLEDPIDLDDVTKLRVELELSSAMFWDNHADLALTVGGTSFGTYESEWVGEENGVFIEEFYSDSLALIDVRLAARLYPLGDNCPIRPYIGGGIGYYWLIDSWEDDYYDTVEDPWFPGEYITYVSGDEDVDTLAHGFFPFVQAGVTVPVGENLELVFDCQLDFEKDDNGYDLAGPIYMFGCRFRF